MKRSIKSIAIMYHYAPLSTTLKIVEQIVLGLMTPFLLYSIQKLIDTVVSGYPDKIFSYDTISWVSIMLVTLALSVNVQSLIHFCI